MLEVRSLVVVLLLLVVDVVEVVDEVVLEDVELLVVDFVDELVEDDVVECVVVVDVVEVDVGVGLVEDAAATLLSCLAPEELESPALKTVMTAVPPFGTVTTQKLPPPAPTADKLLVTSLILFTAGSMLQGKPLQPPLGQSIFRPQVGLTPRLYASGSR